MPSFTRCKGGEQHTISVVALYIHVYQYTQSKLTNFIFTKKKLFYYMLLTLNGVHIIHVTYVKYGSCMGYDEILAECFVAKHTLWWVSSNLQTSDRLSQYSKYQMSCMWFNVSNGWTPKVNVSYGVHFMNLVTSSRNNVSIWFFVCK